MRNTTSIELNNCKVAVEFIAEFNHFSKEPYFCLKIDGKTIAKSGSHLTGYMSNIKETSDERYFFTDVDGLDDINVLPEALGMTRHWIWSNKHVSMKYTHNEVGEAFFQVSTKWPYKIRKAFESFLYDVVQGLNSYNK